MRAISCTAPGDIVLIDNTRVMHGRRAITDPERTILNAQSYARS